MNVMKQRRNIILAVVVLTVLGAGSVYGGFFDRQVHAVEVSRPVKTIIVQKRTQGDILTQVGEIRPAIETSLSFQVSGKLSKRVVSIGGRVKKGDVIAIIDDADLNNELHAAKADLDSARAAEKLAIVTAERNKKLLQADAIAKSEVDSASAQAAAAIEKTKSAEAYFQNAERKVSYSVLKAPDDGVITAVGANSGEVVSQGQMVATIALDKGLDAVFDIDEKMVNAAPEDIKVKISLVSDPKVSAVGKVREVSPSADPLTRTYRVKISIENPPAPMTIGAAVRGEGEVSSSQVIVIPASAITSHEGKPAVYVVDPKTSKVVSTPIAIANMDEKNVYVSSGLSDGQYVIIAGVNKLRPDQLVVLGAGK